MLTMLTEKSRSTPSAFIGLIYIRGGCHRRSAIVAYRNASALWRESGSPSMGFVVEISLKPIDIDVRISTPIIGNLLSLSARAVYAAHELVNRVEYYSASPVRSYIIHVYIRRLVT